MDDNDWDLYAVVRSCSAAAVVPDPFFSFVPLPLLEEENREEAKGREMICFPDLVETESTRQHELDELCRPFCVKPNQQPPRQQQEEELQMVLVPKLAYAPPPSSSSSSSRAASVFPALTAAPYQFRPQPRPSQRPIAQTPRSKRRKNQQKKVVCQVPADGMSTDLWAWRKYGQKPIKGSPYPRGYYRCSSSKGCQARKQVERSLEEPGMLVITYTAEHNHPVPTHRNSLSGSTRQKFPPPNAAAPPPRPPIAEEGEPSPLSSPPAAEPCRMQAEEEDEVEEDEGEEEALLTVADLGMIGEDDMLFMGMEVIDRSTMTTTNGVNKSPATVSVSSAFFEGKGSFEDDFLRPPNWLAENMAAAAGGR